MEITPYLVDHAAPDAYAFLVRADGKSLFYSGDFRAHGRKWKLFYRFLHIAPKDIDYLLLEGTTVSREVQEFPTETQLENDFLNTFQTTKGINLIYVSGQNVDRLVSIYKACKRSGKTFVVDFYIAHILTELHTLGMGVPYPSCNYSLFRVFYPQYLSQKIDGLDKKELFYKFKEFKIDKQEISEKADTIVMVVRSSMDMDFKHIQNLNGGNIIFSMWNGYKKSPTTDKFISTLISQGMTLKSIHTSGHADTATLHKLVCALHPKELIPIHTDSADKYKEIFTEAKVTIAKNRKQMPLKNNVPDTQTGISQTGKLSLVDMIHKIGTIHKKEKSLPSAIFEKAKEYIEPVCEKFGTSALQTVLFSDLMNLYDGYFISIRKLATFMHCKNIDIFKYLDEFDELEQKNFIVMNRKTGRSVVDDGLSFDIPFGAIDAIQKGDMPENPYTKTFLLEDFMSTVYKLCEKCMQGEEKYRRITMQLNSSLKANAHLGIVKKLRSYNFSIDNELILLRFCHYFIDLDRDEMTISDMEKLYEYGSDFRTTKQQLIAGAHVLQQHSLIENVRNGDFADPNAFRLTDKAKEELLFDFDEQLSKKSVKGLKLPKNITEKKLFYSEKTQEQIDELIDLLQEANFISVQKALNEKGMRAGFACLFTGVPGTGKTETVYQIARQTNRSIMQVDIAETKSMWFGESEKKIKEVFTRYRTAVKKTKPTPILLFNEADAIISKRRNLGEDRNGPGQTENTIQNIILQEIENLEGILIATTNLAKNMDKAFARRFLYKIDFEKPTIEARKAIWKEMLPDLPVTAIEILASQFSFSGGQIENISRRNTIKIILSGTPTSLDDLLQICKEESAESAGAKRIGFIDNARQKL
jgi:hypothetical protein